MVKAIQKVVDYLFPIYVNIVVYFFTLIFILFDLNSIKFLSEKLLYLVVIMGAIGATQYRLLVKNKSEFRLNLIVLVPFITLYVLIMHNSISPIRLICYFIVGYLFSKSTYNFVQKKSILLQLTLLSLSLFTFIFYPDLQWLPLLLSGILIVADAYKGDVSFVSEKRDYLIALFVCFIGAVAGQMERYFSLAILDENSLELYLTYFSFVAPVFILFDIYLARRIRVLLNAAQRSDHIQHVKYVILLYVIALGIILTSLSLGTMALSVVSHFMLKFINNYLMMYITILKNDRTYTLQNVSNILILLVVFLIADYYNLDFFLLVFFGYSILIFKQAAFFIYDSLTKPAPAAK